MAEMLQTGCEKAVGDHQENEDDGEVKSAGRPKGKQGSWHPSAPDSFVISALENDRFLDASSHLYMRVCPSVGPSVRPRVTLLSKTGKSMILIANNDVSCNLIIIQSFHHHEDASLALWALFIIKKT